MFGRKKIDVNSPEYKQQAAEAAKIEPTMQNVPVGKPKNPFVKKEVEPVKEEKTAIEYVAEMPELTYKTQMWLWTQEIIERLRSYDKP